MASDGREYIRQALVDFWGEPCEAHDDDCPTCIAWAEFSRIEALEAALRPFGVDGDVLVMSDALSEYFEQSDFDRAWAALGEKP